MVGYGAGCFQSICGFFLIRNYHFLLGGGRLFVGGGPEFFGVVKGKSGALPKIGGK